MEVKVTLKGRVWKFGDEINTDLIIPARYCELTPEEYKKHLLEPVRPDFYSLIQKGDFIFAGQSFGFGSSRGHAVVALQEAGLGAVVADSFARIFYRASINEGLPVIECPEAIRESDEGDQAEIDLAAGTIFNLTRNRLFKFHPFPPLVRDILLSGGGVNYFKKTGLGR